MFVLKSNETYKVYEQGNAIRKTVDYGDYWLPPKIFERLESFSIRSGDIIVSCAGTIGETYVIPDGAPKGVINQALLRLTLNPEIIDEQYFLLMFKSLVDTLKANAVGSAIKNLASIKFLKYETPFLLPPMKEQKRIVAKVQKMITLVKLYTHSYERLKEINKKLPDKLRKSILQYAMQGKLVSQDPNDEPVEVLLENIRAEKQKLFKEGKLKKKDLQESIIYKGDDNSYYEKIGGTIEKIDAPYEIPNTWHWMRLGELCSYIQRGKSPKYIEQSDIPVISQKSIQWSGFNLAPSRFLNPDAINGYDKQRFVTNNDLLWCSTGTGTVGRIGIFTDIDRNGYNTIVADSHVTVVRRFKSINSKYILAYLSSPEIQMNIDEITTGSTKQRELGLVTIKQILVPVCGTSEQKKVIDSILQFEKHIENIAEFVQ